MQPIYVKHYAEPESFARALGFAYDALVHGPVKFDPMATWKSLSERVSQGIYMGEGLLLPHTRVPGLPQPLFAFAVCPKGFTDIADTKSGGDGGDTCTQCGAGLSESCRSGSLKEHCGQNHNSIVFKVVILLFLLPGAAGSGR